MEKLGYIISKQKIKNVLDFVEVVKDISEINDPTKPFLIVGMEEAKKLCKNFSILEKRIEKHVFWTFSKTERRVDYEKDLDNFYNFVLEYNIKNIKYYYINILTIKYNKIKKLINILNNSDKKYIYISKDMIYIYYEDYILGISLSILEYIGISPKKIISKINENKNNIIFTNNSFLNYRMKNIIRNKEYLTSYFMPILSK